MGRMLGFVMTVVVLLMTLPVAAAAAPAGSVIGLSGECFADGAGQRRALKLSDAVQVGETVTVPASGKLKLRMAEGSVVSVAPGSQMTVGAVNVDAAGQRQSAQLSLAQGLIRAVVAPTAQPASFEVNTAVGTAAVRGTDWFIEAAPGAVQVGVLSGSVSLTSAATRRSETIPARWGARLEAGRDPVPARVWSAAEFQAFMARTDLQ